MMALIAFTLTWPLFHGCSGEGGVPEDGLAQNGGDPTNTGNEGGYLPPGRLSEWTEIGPPGGDRFLVVVDPHDPERLVVVGVGAVHRSFDRGGRWESVHTDEMTGGILAAASIRRGRAGWPWAAPQGYS